MMIYSNSRLRPRSFLLWTSCVRGPVVNRELTLNRPILIQWVNSFLVHFQYVYVSFRSGW